MVRTSARPGRSRPDTYRVENTESEAGNQWRNSQNDERRVTEPRLSVVMVNYNTTDLAVDALRSLRLRVPVDSTEVILVDNASTTFDADRVLEAWPGAQVIELAENVGFGQGNNAGAARASAAYLWLLNTDTLCPDDNGLAAMLQFLDDHPDYAGVSPLLTDATGAVQPWQTGYFPSLWRMALSPIARQLAHRAPSLRNRLAFIDTDHRPRVPAEVDHVVAAAMVVRRSAFEAVGGFSPEYFFFLEDTDLCRKLRAEGWKIGWLPGSHMIHLWGRSVADPLVRQRMFFSAQDVYLRRWHGPATVRAAQALRIPLRTAARLERVRRRPSRPATRRRSRS